MDRSAQAGRAIDNRNLHSRRRNPTRQPSPQKEPKWQTLPRRPDTLRSTASTYTTRSTAPADRWSCCTVPWGRSTCSESSHGRTADIDRPLRYEQMADDTAALLRHLNIDNADVFGYSLGGGIALQLAIRHPDLVRKLVVASATYNNDGLYPEVLATHAKGAGSLGFGGAMLDGLNDLLPEIFGVGIHPTTIPRGPTPLQDALVPC
jgi:pimeloyl-ACP methyl ester carboxylesterase